MKKIIIILLALMGCTSQPSAVDNYTETVDAYVKTVDEYKHECKELQKAERLNAWAMHENGWLQGYNRALWDQIKFQESGLMSTPHERNRWYKMDSLEVAAITPKIK